MILILLNNKVRCIFLQFYLFSFLFLLQINFYHHLHKRNLIQMIRNFESLQKIVLFLKSFSHFFDFCENYFWFKKSFSHSFEFWKIFFDFWRLKNFMILDFSWFFRNVEKIVRKLKKILFCNCKIRRKLRKNWRKCLHFKNFFNFPFLALYIYSSNKYTISFFLSITIGKDKL